MELKITKGKALFNKSKLGSDKQVVFVEFPNCISTKTNKSFKWMPRYDELERIKEALEDIENESWNKELIKEEEKGSHNH